MPTLTQTCVFLNRFVYLSPVEIIKIFDGKARDPEKSDMSLRLVAVAIFENSLYYCMVIRSIKNKTRFWVATVKSDRIGDLILLHDTSSDADRDMRVSPCIYESTQYSVSIST